MMGFLASKVEGSSKFNNKERIFQFASNNVSILRVILLATICCVAFSIRLFSVLRFESVIHEFDPWFNFRATKYLVENGWYNFLNWFDERAWYPLGRVVGVTVYPGIMITSAIMHYITNGILAFELDIKEICVFLGPIFSALTALTTYFMTKELKDSGAGLVGAAFMAIVPGYISRSVAGSYDNEAISIFLMMATFYCWIKAVKKGSGLWGIATALFYFYMVSSWGGYVFIINLIPLHIFTLLCMGRYTHRLYVAYCSFYVIGTLASLTIPFVGLQPTRSSEHMAAMGVFCLMQLMAAVDVVRKLVDDEAHFKKLARVMVITVFGILLLGLIGLSLSGRIAPWAGRFYSLWDTSYARKHIPIIASVSEHQPTTWGSFFFDMNALLFLAPAGLFLCFQERRNEHIFAILYVITGSYFASVMVRLMLTLAPIMCVLGAIAVGDLLNRYSLGSETSSRLAKSPLTLDMKAPVLISLAMISLNFVWHCTWVTNNAYSSPSIMLSSVDPRSGNARIIDDFREAYYWLRRNTDYDSKVLAWWDYGYQLSGMADRITIVDNNTWNNTHIANVGRILASTETKAYPLLRQLDVDYVLILSGVLSGFSGDDINKFLWMVRIAEGEYPQDVHERSFLTTNGEFRLDKNASPTMQESMLYKMTYQGIAGLMGNHAVDRARQMPITGVDPKLSIVDEAYSTDNQIVRIFKVKKLDILGRSLFKGRKVK